MLGEISFAGKVGYNIKFDDVKQRLLDDLHDHFGFKVIQKHHEKYHDGIINKLTSNPHLVCLRSNGNPYLLYLTKINFVQQCVFVDKKIQQGYFYPRMIMSRFRFDDRLFENGGTLLDGEMIRTNEGKWLFMFGDMIAYQGSHLSNTNLVKRMNMLYNMLRHQFISEECDICTFQVKKYVTYSEISSLITDFMPQLPYTSRGLYFKPLFLKFKDILYNFDDSLIVKVMRKKYKNVSNFLLEEDKACLLQNGQPSGDVQSLVKPVVVLEPQDQSPSIRQRKTFMVKKTNLPDVYEMVVTSQMDGKSNAEIACIPSLSTSKFMRSLFESKNLTERIELICEYSERFGRFIPIALP